MTLFTWKPKRHSKKRERYEGMGLPEALRQPLLSGDNAQEEQCQTLTLQNEYIRAQELKPERQKKLKKLRDDILTKLYSLEKEEDRNNTMETIKNIFITVSQLQNEIQSHDAPRQNYDILKQRLKYEMAVKKHEGAKCEESKRDTQILGKNCSYT